MKLKNVSVSAIQQGDDIKVWCATFSVKGSIPPGDERARRRVEKRIAALLEALDYDPNALR